jgi:predicted nuclease of predicted toxin-antitoxin system
MIFWLDAQLPPSLAAWLQQSFAVRAQSLRELGLRDADDQTIFDRARAADAIVISKDADFVELVSRHGPPHKLIWVTCGNASNAHLRRIFQALFQQACQRLSAGASVVELGDRQ